MLNRLLCDEAVELREKMLRVLMALFYTGDGFIASWDPEMLQDACDVLVALFERIGLGCNTTKTKRKKMKFGFSMK